MRFFSSFALVLCVSIAAAGCSQQLAGYNGNPAAPQVSGVDNVVYGAAPSPGPAGAQYAPPARGLIFAQSAAAPAPAPAPSRGFFDAQSAPAPFRDLIETQSTPAPAPSVTGSLGSGNPPDLAAGPPPRGLTYAQAAPPPGPPPPVVAAPIFDTFGPQPGPVLYGSVPTVTPAPTMGHYTLDSGDRLRVVVFGQEGLTNSYLVSATGQIDMPLIGSVVARGETTDQLAGRIGAKLRDGYIREPHVAVEVEAYRPFFILGEVTQPGQYPYVANMTAETAVAIAGGFTPRAFRRDLVLSRTANGIATRMTVPLNFPLRPGDTINVQERWF
jgi:polysaccharide biosynthesis/export protein